MTPGARIAAATEILDAWNEGDAVEKLLTNWGRRSRFAGSKDRAAVRDLVFDALRNLNRYAAIGKGWNGRALMIGRLFALGEDPDQYFTGEGYMPEALSDEERLQGDTTGIVNLQDWILPKMQDSLESDFDANEKALCCRAPLFLRVNTEQTNVEDVIARLAKEQIIARPHPLSPTALEVTENPRRFAGSEVFRTGLAEIQDAASQAVSDLVPVTGRAPQSVGQLRFWDDLTYFLDVCTVRNSSTQTSASGHQPDDLAAGVGFVVHHPARVTRDFAGRDGLGRHSSFSV